MILYEYPLNERIRTLLRLEDLFTRLDHFMTQPGPLEHHVAITTLFEILEVASRADLKSDLLQELERQRLALGAFRDNPAVSAAALDQVLAQIDAATQALSTSSGRTGQHLRDHEWLMSIRNRAGIAGGTCEFDLPAYFAWKHLPATRRQQDLRNWIHTLRPLAASIRLLLNLLRQSGTPQKVSVVGGQYQQSLQQGRTSQLVRVALDREAELIPEISGNRLVLSIRLLRLGEDARLHASGQDATLEITLCA